MVRHRPDAAAATLPGEKLLKLAGRRDFLVRADAVFLSIAFEELDSGKARRELGWTPRPFRETVRDAIAWFADREKVAPLDFPPPFGIRG